MPLFPARPAVTSVSTTLSPVSTGIGDRLRAGIPPWYVTKPTRSTQPCIRLGSSSLHMAVYFSPSPVPSVWTSFMNGPFCLWSKVSHLSSPSFNNPFGIFVTVAAYCGIFLNPVIYLSHYAVVKTALVAFLKKITAEIRCRQVVAPMRVWHTDTPTDMHSTTVLYRVRQ